MKRPDYIYTGYGAINTAFGLRWKHWNSPTATATGKARAIKRTGGYYRGAVKVKLRAGSIGRCYSGGPRAYRVLWSKEQVSPGSSRWTRWHHWMHVKSLCTGAYDY